MSGCIFRYDGVSTIDQTECYSVEKNRWFEATSMNHFRCFEAFNFH